MNYPTELQLLQFFGVDPVVDDDVSTYTVSDARGLELSVSFNIADDSLQTAIRFKGGLVDVVSYEGMTKFWIDCDLLSAEFLQTFVKVSVRVRVQPNIEINWSGLRV